MRPPPSSAPIPWKGLGNAIPDALLLVGARGLIQYANPQAHTLFGYEPGGLRGHLIEDLVPPEVRVLHAGHRERYVNLPRLREMGNRLVAIYGMRRSITAVIPHCKPAAVWARVSHTYGELSLLTMDRRRFTLG